MDCQNCMSSETSKAVEHTVTSVGPYALYNVFFSRIHEILATLSSFSPPWTTVVTEGRRDASKFSNCEAVK